MDKNTRLLLELFEKHSDLDLVIRDNFGKCFSHSHIFGYEGIMSFRVRYPETYNDFIKISEDLGYSLIGFEGPGYWRVAAKNGKEWHLCRD